MRELSSSHKFQNLNTGNILEPFRIHMPTSKNNLIVTYMLHYKMVSNLIFLLHFPKPMEAGWCHHYLNFPRKWDIQDEPICGKFLTHHYFSRVKGKDNTLILVLNQKNNIKRFRMSTMFMKDGGWKISIFMALVQVGLIYIIGSLPNSLSV